MYSLIFQLIRYFAYSSVKVFFPSIITLLLSCFRISIGEHVPEESRCIDDEVSSTSESNESDFET